MEGKIEDFLMRLPNNTMVPEPLIQCRAIVTQEQMRAPVLLFQWLGYNALVTDIEPYKQDSNPKSQSSLLW